MRELASLRQRTWPSSSENEAACAQRGAVGRSAGPPRGATPSRGAPARAGLIKPGETFYQVIEAEPMVKGGPPASSGSAALPRAKRRA